MAILPLIPVYAPATLVISITLCLLLYAAYSIHSYARLSHIPGPFLAAWSNLPRMYWVWTRSSHLIHLDLHRKYGKLVRLGPNSVSCGDPAEIPTIYGFNGKWIKSDFYWTFMPLNKGKITPMMFTTQDEDQHRMLKRPVANIYSMGNIAKFEHLVDNTLEVFFHQIDKLFVETGGICDFGVWLQRFAFDVMGELTFSKRLGFLERDEDVDGIMQAIWNHFEYASVVGQIPWLDYFGKKNPITWRFKQAKLNPVVTFAMANAAERKKMREKGETSAEMNDRDFYSRFLDAKMKDPSIPDWALMAWTTSNITAGSDTTAIVMRSILYNLFQHPKTLARLLDELKTASKEGRVSNPVTWKEARDLPYLDACIKEGGRIHPPFGLPLERVVPPEGAIICGKEFKGGTAIGIHAWAAHRDKGTFGEDADHWRPERWLCDEAQRKIMEQSLLTFGAGHRVCLGKHVSYMEIYKLIPSLFQRYDIKLSQPEKYFVEARWFAVQRNFCVQFHRRDITKMT